MKYKEAKYEVITSAYANEFRASLKGFPVAPDILSRCISDAGFNYLPESMENKLKAVLKDNSIFRSLGSVFTGYDGSVAINTFTYDDYAEFVPEGEEIPIIRPDEDFDRLSVSCHKLAVFYKLPIEFVHDSAFNTEDYIAKRTAKNVANAENKAFLLGDGENEPVGLLNDEGGAEVGVTADALSYDGIVDLFFSVKPEYRSKAVWIMNDQTALALRKLKDEAGFPLWNGNNDTILGKPVVICNEMPDADAGEKCILFGDMSYYWVIERSPVCLKILNELFAIRGQIGYMGAEFIDGKLIHSDAVKVLQIEAEE